MFAMTIAPEGRELVAAELPVPEPGEHEVLIEVLACGICRTDLHVIDDELGSRRPGLVPGHEIVGRVVRQGASAKRFAIGTRVGVPWLGGACFHCRFCLQHDENLCDTPVFTGWDRDGGFAQFVAADQRFCFALPPGYDDTHAAPLLCAGLIGHRAYRSAQPAAGSRIGLYGFGAAAHILCQLAVSLGHEVFAFVRKGDERGAAFARELGAAWAGPSDELPPAPLDSAIIFAAAGGLVPAALRATRKGGTVVCAGIHMSPIPQFDYALLWGERTLKSVANLTREDGDAFFELIGRHPVHTHVRAYALAQANTAIAALRAGLIDGAAVLVPAAA